MKAHRLLAGIVGAVCVCGSTTAAGQDSRVTTTVYVGRHFEVRDHDQPVKYVFNGETRVVRITGSLSQRGRVQRIRLRAGWNLVSFAVTATNALQQLSAPAGQGGGEIQSAYLWNPAGSDYSAVMSGQTVNAGSVLWIKAAADKIVGIAGAYSDPAVPNIPVGGSFAGGHGLEAWNLELPAGVTIWKFDAASKNWQAGFAGDLSPVNDLPSHLAPGEAIYVHPSAPVELAGPDPSLRVAYYHPDHLGSSSVATDAGGALVEETAYYPFGATRNEERLRAIETHYGFAQRERDTESGLHYVGHRYQHPVIGKWISPDPLAEAGGGANPYAYVNQNPLNLHDPDGSDIKVVKTTDSKTKVTTYDIRVKAALIDTTSTKFDQKDLAASAAKLKSTIEQNLTGKEGKTRWKTTMDLRVIKDWKDVEKDDHVFRIVDATRSGAAGEARRGGRLMTIKAHAYKKPTPDQVDQTNPANKHYTWENYTSPEGTGMHELVHTAGLGHDNSHRNLMQEGSVRKFDEKRVTRGQIETIFKAQEKNQLNQRDPDLDALTKGN